MKSMILTNASGRHLLALHPPHPHHPIDNKIKLHGTSSISSVTRIWICKIYEIRMGFKCVDTESGGGER